MGQAGVVALGVMRVALSLLHLVRGIVICGLLFPWLKPAQRMRHVRQFSMQALRFLGVRIEVVGTPHVGPVLLAANHISWLDILAINAAHPARFVSKSDVRRWPVIGWIVACGGTLFIERERKRDAMRVVHQVADALRAGDVIAMFPEGTTSDGHGLLPFHANLLQAAIATEVPVQAIALRYRDTQHAVSPAAAYVGDMNLVQSLWLIATARGLCVRLEFLPAQGTRHLDRRALSEKVRGEVGRALGV
jgi:1-acyl-sn-glycerol-3-phosphate acyltransferase